MFIESFGCQMNDYDTQRMVEVLRAGGWERTERADDADLVVLNTCSIREKAEAKVASAAGLLRAWRSGPDAPRGRVLALAGCVAQQEGERLLQRVPHADLCFGPDQIPRLPDLLARVRADRRRVAATNVIDVEDYTFLDADPLPGEVRACELVTIQKGCDNHCAFCVVPHTRGREVSRPAAEVVREVERLVALGAREVTLIGQNVNSYHGAGETGDDFALLLAMVDRVPDLARLRFTTSHPKDFTRAVARAFAELPRLCGWLHLPVQSGSSRTLKRMVRGYDRAEYLERIAWVRAARPDLSLTSDVIVGYPGETADDFAETLSLLAEVEYDAIYSFEYSERPGTPALKLCQRDDVPPEEKRARLLAVQELQREVSARRLARFVGRVCEVLVEGASRQAGPGRNEACGRLSGNEMVNFLLAPGGDPARLAGRLGRVRIDEVRAHTLAGRLEA